MITAKYKQGFTKPDMLVDIYLDEVPYGLTDKTIKLRFSRAGQPALWERPMTVVGAPTAGRVAYTWQAADRAVSGVYDCLIFVEHAGDTEPIAEFQIEIETTVPKASA